MEETKNLTDYTEESTSSRDNITKYYNNIDIKQTAKESAIPHNNMSARGSIDKSKVPEVSPIQCNDMTLTGSNDISINVPISPIPCNTMTGTGSVDISNVLISPMPYNTMTGTGSVEISNVPISPIPCNTMTGTRSFDIIDNPKTSQMSNDYRTTRGSVDLSNNIDGLRLSDSNMAARGSIDISDNHEASQVSCNNMAAMESIGVINNSEELPTSRDETTEGESIEDCINQMRKEMSDNKKNKRPIHSLTSFDGSCRSKIAKYLSTGAFEELEVNFDNVEQYLYIAKELGHVDLLRYCENELLKQLTAEVSLDMMQLAYGYDLQRLQVESEKIIEDNFVSVYPTDDFQYLGKNEVISLLKRPKIKSHELVKNAVEHWFLYEREFREAGFNEMCEILKNSKEEVVHEKPCSKCLQYVCMFTYDEVEKLPRVLIMNIKTLKMTSIHVRKLGNIGSDFAVCCHQNDEGEAPYIYMACGNGKTSNRLFKFDVVMSKWKETNNLKEGRRGFCLVCVENSLYILGGMAIGNGQNVSAVDERKSGKPWKEIGTLKQAVRSPAYAKYKDNIYLFGGVLDNGEYSPAIQCFNVRSRETKVVSECPSPFPGGRAITLNDKIYILTNQGLLYIFDVLTHKCTEGAMHAHALSQFALLTNGVDLFTAGGVCGETECIQDIYRYTVKQDQWQKLDMTLPYPMRIHGYCEVFIQADFDLVPFVD